MNEKYEISVKANHGVIDSTSHVEGQVCNHLSCPSPKRGGGSAFSFLPPALSSLQDLESEERLIIAKRMTAPKPRPMKSRYSTGRQVKIQPFLTGKSLIMFTTEATYFQTPENPTQKAFKSIRNAHTDFLNNSPYGSWLHENLAGIHADVVACGRSGYEGRCDGPERHKFYRAVHCQHTPFCPQCADRERRELTGSYLDLLYDLNRELPNLYAVFFELTFPRELWDKVTLASAFKNAGDCLRGYFTDTPGSVLAFHDWHSKEPLRGRYPHVHGLMLNYKFDGESERFMMVDNYIDVAIFKEMWAGVLNREYPGFDFKPAGLNVRARYVKLSGAKWSEKDKKFVLNRVRVAHRLNYMFRRPLLDVARFCIENPDCSFDYVPEGEMVPLLRPRDGKRIRCYGWLADGYKNKRLALLGLHHKTRKERREEDAERLKTCPICKAGLEWGGRVRLADIGRDFYVWCVADPPPYHDPVKHADNWVDSLAVLLERANGTLITIKEVMERFSLDIDTADREIVDDGRFVEHGPGRWGLKL